MVLTLTTQPVVFAVSSSPEINKHSVGFASGSVVKNLLTVQESQETRVRSPGWEDPLEEGMATHTSILAWKIPWTKEPGRLRSQGRKKQDMTAAT